MIRLPPIIIEIEVDRPDVLNEPPIELFTRALRRGAMLAAGYIAGGLWPAIAMEAGLRSTGAYIRGIQQSGRITVVQEPALKSGMFEMVIEIVNTDPKASIVEDGHGAFHLPSKIDWGRTTGSIKRTKEGKPYLHIPFRHRAAASMKTIKDQGYLPSTVKAMMPSEIYKQAKQLAFTTKQHQGRQYSQQFGREGQFVAADRYNWGGRLKRSPGRTGFHQSRTGQHYEERRSSRSVGRDRHGMLVNPAWSSSKYAGMFRAGGGSTQTSYHTIRTITPDSLGWNIPATPGYGIARKVASKLKEHDHVRELFELGVMEVLGGKV